MRYLVSLCFPILFLWTGFTLSGQVLFNVVPKQNVVSLSNGLNRYEPFTTLSLARGFHINLFNLIKDDLTLFIDFSDKTDFKNDNAFRIIYGGQGSIVKHRSFMLIFRKTFGVSWYRLPQNVKATYVGAEFELMPGIYKQKYFIALDLYYGDNLKGYIGSGGNIESVVKEVGKGWFKPELATFRTGINLGYHFSKHWTIFGNIDFFVVRPRNSESYYPATPLFFGYMGMNYLFPAKELPKPDSE